MCAPDIPPLEEKGIPQSLGSLCPPYHRRIHQEVAALVHEIVCNHGFANGNKRTALYPVDLLAQEVVMNSWKTTP